MASTILSLILAAATLCLWYGFQRYLHSSKLPPGPLSLPIIGALFSMPTEREWITYADWKSKYGDIVCANVFGRKIIIINTAELSRELLHNRAALYSDRPDFPMLDLMGMLSWNLGVMKSGSHHRRNRKLLLDIASTRTMRKSAGVQQREASLLLLRLLESPAKFFLHFRRMVAGNILEIFHGHRIKPGTENEDQFVLLQDALTQATSLGGSPGAYLVNLFPTLRYWPAWLPGSGFQRDAEVGRILCEKALALPILLDPDIQGAEDKRLVTEVATVSYAAGVETTTSTLLTFVLAMVLYPDVQIKAQAEIDRVLEKLDRLPNLEDRAAGRLPFIDAIVTECHRWRPAGRFGLPHLLSQEDVVGPYVLPKGATIMSNVWSIFRDETVYPLPNEFRPERFLGDNKAPDPREHAYGYGRRACPGRILAEASLWLGVASVLAGFNITPEGDVNDLDDDNYTSGVMSRPMEFPCHFIPRNDRIVRLIRQAGHAAEGDSKD